MKLLLDTHIIIWALTDDNRLSDAAREMILSTDHIVLVSAASFWEISIKNQKAPEKCPYDEKIIFDYCKEAGFEMLPVLPEHVFALRSLKIKEGQYLANYDPFDRIILSQAKAEDAWFLSHDNIFSRYDEKCIKLI